MKLDSDSAVCGVAIIHNFDGSKRLHHSGNNTIWILTYFQLRTSRFILASVAFNNKQKKGLKLDDKFG